MLTRDLFSSGLTIHSPCSLSLADFYPLSLSPPKELLLPVHQVQEHGDSGGRERCDGVAECIGSITSGDTEVGLVT